MKVCSVTIPGFETITQDEVKFILKKSSSSKDSVVIFETNSFDDIAKFTFMSRTSNKVLLLIDQKKDADFKIDLPIKNNFKSFKVKCKRVGTHDFSSHSIEEKVGGLIIDKYGYKVNLETPDIIFYVYIFHDDYYLGIDLSGIDLSKRDYKIFNTHFSMKGNLAFNILKLAGLKKGSVLLDPLTKSSEFVIEAASYFSGESIHKYLNFFFTHFEEFKKHKFTMKKIEGKIFGFTQNQRDLSHAKKNAKIVDVNKDINFSRIDLDWIDTKFDENSIDLMTCIIPPAMTKTEIQELFHQAKYCLKKDGKMALITKKTINHSGFEKTHNLKSNSGTIYILKKK